MNGLSYTHFDKPVPHFKLKLKRFYAIGKTHGLPTDNGSLKTHIGELNIERAGSKSIETILPGVNSQIGAKNGNEIQHKAIVETFLGEGAWPFPEYYDLEGKERDEDLAAFHAELDKRFKIIRFKARGTENSNQNVEYDTRYVSAGLSYEEKRNNLRLGVSFRVLHSEGPEDSKFPFQRVATIWAKELTAEIFSEGDAPSFLKKLIPNEKANFEELDTDNGFRFQLTIPEEIDKAKIYKAFTPYISYSPPDDDCELVVIVRSGMPHYKINDEVIKDDQGRFEAHKIARNYMDRKLQRATKPHLDLGRLEEEFVVYRMSYSHYDK